MARGKDIKKRRSPVYLDHTKYIGRRYGRLVVLKDLGVCLFNNSGRRRVYLCSCDCGKEFKILRQSLVAGALSCGCLTGVATAIRLKTHGLSDSPEYKTWDAMVQRCTNPKSKVYSYYGGRGIKVCERWLKFENFYKDMGKRPNGLEIDRINNDGNYEPSNCRWTDRKTQMNNTRPKKPYKNYGGRIRDELSHLLDEGVSSKILYKMRHIRDGKCVSCQNVIFNNTRYCKFHLSEHSERQRNARKHKRLQLN